MLATFRHGTSDWDTAKDFAVEYLSSAPTISSEKMATIDMLPNEVLEAIFELCCAGENANGITYLYRGRSRLPFQHNLLRVCQRWWNIVVHARPLWSSIWISEETGGSASHRLRLALHRSGEAPLDIKATSCDWQAHAPLIAPHTRRLRTLSLELCTWDWTPMRPNCVPVLENLDFRLFRLPKASHESVSAAFGNAPALRRLTCSPMLAIRVTFPWTQIVELRIHSDGPSSWIRTPMDTKCFFDIIAIAPLRLLICTVNTLAGPPITKPDVEVAQLPPRWLPQFTLPSLRKYIHRGTAGSETKPVLELIQRSMCTLTHLDICDFSVTNTKVGDLEAFLSALPQLKEFDLHVPVNTDANISDWELLWPLLANKDILPELRAMRLRTQRNKIVSPFTISIKLKCLIFDIGLSILEAGRQALRLLDMDFRDVRWDRKTEGKVLDEAGMRERLRGSADEAQVDLCILE